MFYIYLFKFLILILDQEKEFLENYYKIWNISDHNIYDHNVQMRRTLSKTLLQIFIDSHLLQTKKHPMFDLCINEA